MRRLRAIVGVMYDNGEGVSQDYQEAFRWYSRAAAQNNDLAQNNLGVLYEGVARDYQEAVKWYRLAAEQGNAQAQFNHGQISLEGEAVSKNMEEALYEEFSTRN